jgi:RNA polymerase sigma-70 factor (ECF subfamily)
MADIRDNANLGELVRQARSGDRQSMDCLVHLVEGPMRAYLYRLTLDGDLTEDLLQESLLQMIESLRSLEQPDAFRVWLYRTALGKVQHHFRQRRREAKLTEVSAGACGSSAQAVATDTTDGLTAMMRQELLDATSEAIGKLGLRQRSILVLRCFEQRPYDEVAAIMNCSEMAAQVLLCRAKRSVKKHLSRRGLAGLWLVGLWSFARKTAPAAAAPTAGQIAQAVADIGALPAIIGAIGAKLSVAGAMAVAAVVLIATVGGAIHDVGTRSGLPAAGGVAESAPELEGFQHPDRLIRAYDPDGDGWKGIEANQVVAVPVDPNAWLLGPPPSEQASIVLPVGHWLELGFAGPITDGPGDDVFIVEWGRNGEQASVFITDGASNARLLGVLTVKDSGQQLATKTGFDIFRIRLPFVPRALRIVSITGGGGTPGFDLHSVQARIREQRGPNPAQE